MTRFPDFFIVGAPKCGTTSLYRWLSQHPDVFVPRMKEPMYFAFDHPRRRPVSNLDQYLSLFADAKPGQICGEASTGYLYSDFAIPEILDANPQAKIIMMVRNPLEMVISMHVQKLHSRVDHIEDFEEAWRVSPNRDHWLNYQQSCQLGRYLERVRSMVREQQLWIVVFDDIKVQPDAVYRDVLSFLGKSFVPRIRFDAFNVRRKRRLEFLENFMRQPPAPVAWLKDRALEIAPIRMRILRERIDRLNSKPTKREPMADHLRREIADFYRDDVALLGNLLGRDLSHWTAQP